MKISNKTIPTILIDVIATIKCILELTAKYFRCENFKFIFGIWIISIYKSLCSSNCIMQF